jgi:trigger factor
MKTELKDVSVTRKDLVVEVPGQDVEEAIGRVASSYRRRARVPGFRPGKAPAAVIRQRFREQILQDVAQELIPKTMTQALRELGQSPLDTPTVRDLLLKEGEPLSYRASFETLPPIDPGDYSTFTLRRRPAALEDGAVEQALEQLRQRAARFEPVEDRAAQPGDTLTGDVTRHVLSGERPAGDPESHEEVAIEIGAAGNPPGLDDALDGMRAGETRVFTLTYPDDYDTAELAGASVEFTASVKSIRLRVLPALDDEFAKDVGDFESLEQLTERVTEDLQQQLERERDREVRTDLLGQLAGRIADTEVPAVLTTREVDHRVEEFVRRLVDQRVDPTRANIDWEQFRESQHESATEAVRSTLVLDEIARREQIEVTGEEVDAEVARHAERIGRTPSAVRAQLEKDGGLGRVREGMRREKAMDFLMSRARVVEA